MTCYDDKNDKRMININIDRIFSIEVALKSLEQKYDFFFFKI